MIYTSSHQTVIWVLHSTYTHVWLFSQLLQKWIFTWGTGGPRGIPESPKEIECLNNMVPLSFPQPLLQTTQLQPRPQKQCFNLLNHPIHIHCSPSNVDHNRKLSRDDETFHTWIKRGTWRGKKTTTHFYHVLCHFILLAFIFSFYLFSKLSGVLLA